MENKRPEFALKEASVLTTITELHSYFRDLQSYYKIAQGQLTGQLEAIQDVDEAEVLNAKLQEIRQKIDYFHVINNAISIVNTVVHTGSMIAELHQQQKP